MDDELKVPKKLGKFEIIKEIGRGSMAAVYLGYDPFMNRNVAVKVAYPRHLKDIRTGDLFRRMFFNEARIAGMLDNRFILPVYDAGTEGDLLYIIMEYVEGGATLKRHTGRDDLLPVPRVLEIMYKCCRGLDYAHSRDVIHRDIKPGNILLTEDMDVRVADFGIAQIIRADETQFAGMMGSPRYMSPEQASEKPLTRRTDIFSLGVVMFELLTGEPPFNSTNIAALTKMIMNAEPPLLRSINPDVPEGLEMVIKRALAKSPDTRYQSCMDFAADIVLSFKQQKAAAFGADTSRQEKLRRLKENRFFKDFFDSELQEVLEASEWGEFRPEETVISEGALDNSFYIVVKGSVKVVKGGAVLAALGPGDCFGEMAYFSKAKRTASVVASDDVMLLKVNNTLIERASVNCQVRFLREFLKVLIERLSITTERLTEGG